MSSTKKEGRTAIYESGLKIAIAREYFTGNLGYGKPDLKYNLPTRSIIHFVRWYRKKYPDGKHQVGLKQVFKNYASTVTAVCSAIDAYNCLRPHMSVSNLTPQQAHLSTQPLIKKWKDKKKYHQNKESTV